jgi:hypothetical protein
MYILIYFYLITIIIASKNISCCNIFLCCYLLNFFFYSSNLLLLLLGLNIFLVSTICPIVNNSSYISLWWKYTLQLFQLSKLIRAVNLIICLFWHKLDILCMKLQRLISRALWDRNEWQILPKNFNSIVAGSSQKLN